MISSFNAAISFSRSVSLIKATGVSDGVPIDRLSSSSRAASTVSSKVGVFLESTALRMSGCNPFANVILAISFVMTLATSESAEILLLRKKASSNSLTRWANSYTFSAGFCSMDSSSAKADAESFLSPKRFLNALTNSSNVPLSSSGLMRVYSRAGPLRRRAARCRTCESW